jgi:hypothetical protein
MESTVPPEPAEAAAPLPPERAPGQPPADVPPPPSPDAPSLAADDGAATRRRREAAALLGEFRRTAVLVPLSDDGFPLTGEYGGVRWIYAFSDEPSLARFAIARGEGTREWTYDRVLGARLLDVAIPAMPEPYGVALDVGSEGQGALFPPVTGIVPDAAAVDADTDVDADADVDVDVDVDVDSDMHVGETNGPGGDEELAR